LGASRSGYENSIEVRWIVRWARPKCSMWLSANSDELFYWVITSSDGSVDTLWSLKGYNARVPHIICRWVMNVAYILFWTHLFSGNAIRRAVLTHKNSYIVHYEFKNRTMRLSDPNIILFRNESSSR